ncbi:hypothetical protein [Methylobacterium nigriterrae]|uniref:hypothetical protein n=1 Tax=Methylobacterium nigriterrae TaxID=3127512 RepID=UPI003013A994
MSQAIVGVSATELSRGRVLDTNSEYLSAGPEEPASEPGSARLQLNRAGWSELNRLAQDLRMPLPSLMAEAFNDVLLKHERPPVVEARASSEETGWDRTLTLDVAPPATLWPVLMGAWVWHQTVTLPLLALWSGSNRLGLR